jgi:hypothetical protein
MRRRFSGLVLLALLAGAGATASDLVNLSKNRQQVKQQNDAAARQFVTTLHQKDPCYYPIAAGLSSLQCRLVFPSLEKVRQEAEKDLPQEKERTEWSADFYWQAPDMFYLSKEPWMNQLGDGDRISAVMSVQQSPLWILDLSPFPFDEYSLEYVSRPDDPLPHLVKAVPKDSNRRNSATDLFYDASYRLQKKVIVSELQRLSYAGFAYKPAAGGLLKTGFVRQNQSENIQYKYVIDYDKIGKFWIPVRISIDTDALVDSKLRDILPLIIELKDVVINQPLPEDVQSRLMHYAKQ